MIRFEPCPCCGRKLTWNDVVELDEEGCPAVHFPDVITVLLNCDCGFNFMIPAELVDYPMTGWEDRFADRANMRVNAPKRMCGNCKHWKEIVDGSGKCDCRLNIGGDGQLSSRFNDTGDYEEKECDKWESVE